jgi:hypothetical protein
MIRALSLLVLPLALALAACATTPIGLYGKSPDQIAVEGDDNMCDPARRLFGNPAEGPSPNATTDMQRRRYACRDAGPRQLLRDER